MWPSDQDHEYGEGGRHRGDDNQRRGAVDAEGLAADGEQGREPNSIDTMAVAEEVGHGADPVAPAAFLEPRDNSVEIPVVRPKRWFLAFHDQRSPFE